MDIMSIKKPDAQVQTLLSMDFVLENEIRWQLQQQEIPPEIRWKELHGNQRIVYHVNGSRRLILLTRADILTNGRCVHPELKKFNLIISGRDWCNLFDEISQEQIDQMQKKAMQSEQ